MHLRSKHVLGALLALLLVGVAYSPLLLAGFVASDWSVLIEGRRDALQPAASMPVASLGLRASRELCGLLAGEERGRCALILRTLNLAFYLCSAPCLYAFARRLLLPWCGSEQARAAALATTLIFAVHPLAPPAIATVASQGELIGLFFGMLGLALFLAGRQDRVFAKTVASLLCCALAGLSAELALGLPLCLAASEFLSAHRYRPLRVRLRTAATTLAVFGAAVSIETVMSVFRRGVAALPEGLQTLLALASWGDVRSLLVSSTEKLGLLVLPSNPLSLGIAGTALAGAVFVLVMQPALVAARSAPKLWGWILATWCAALFVSNLFHAHLELAPEGFALARWLLPSVVPMAIGLGLGATALAGMRRWYLSWIAALGYAVVSNGNARPWIEASRSTEFLRTELVAARELYGSRPILVVDPPPARAGVESVGAALPWLLHPWIDGGDDRVAAGELRGLGLQAFLELVRQPEFSRYQKERCVIVFPLSSADFEPPAHGFLELQEERPSETPRSWRASLASPTLDLDTLKSGALVVTAPSNADFDALRQVSWRTKRNEPPDRGTVDGVWLTGGAEALGIFDLGSSLEWRLGGRARTIFFPHGTGAIGAVDVVEELPSLGELVLSEQGEDFVLSVPENEILARAAGRGRFAFGLFDLARLDSHDFPVELERERLHARGAAAAVRERGGTGIAWRLDYQVDSLAIARSRGRL